MSNLPIDIPLKVKYENLEQLSSLEEAESYWTSCLEHTRQKWKCSENVAVAFEKECILYYLSKATPEVQRRVLRLFESVVDWTTK